MAVLGASNSPVFLFCGHQPWEECVLRPKLDSEGSDDGPPGGCDYIPEDLRAQNNLQNPFCSIVTRQIVSVHKVPRPRL